MTSGPMVKGEKTTDEIKERSSSSPDRNLTILYKKQTASSQKRRTVQENACKDVPQKELKGGGHLVNLLGKSGKNPKAHGEEGAIILIRGTEGGEKRGTSYTRGGEEHSHQPPKP